MATSVPSILLPRPSFRWELRDSFNQLYYAWRVAYEKAHPAPPITNVRYSHDFKWRTDPEWYTLENARQMKSPIWKATRVAFSLGAANLGAAGIGVAAATVLPVLLSAAVMYALIEWKHRHEL